MLDRSMKIKPNNKCENIPGVSSARISKVVPLELDLKGSREGTPSKRKFNVNLEDTESALKKIMFFNESKIKTKLELPNNPHICCNWKTYRNN